MKTIHYVVIGFICSFFLMNTQLFAQPGAPEHKQMNHFNKGESMIPNLSDEQKAKIKDLRLNHFKEVKPLRNQIGELKAKQHTLTTADKADMKAIDANIDEISKIQAQLMKSRAQLVQQIRSVLTDEQRVYFDMHGMKNFGQRGMQHREFQKGMRHQQEDKEDHMEHMN